jgi:hypothetical protein
VSTMAGAESTMMVSRPHAVQQAKARREAVVARTWTLVVGARPDRERLVVQRAAMRVRQHKAVPSGWG